MRIISEEELAAVAGGQYDPNDPGTIVVPGYRPGGGWGWGGSGGGTGSGGIGSGEFFHFHDQFGASEGGGGGGGGYIVLDATIVPPPTIEEMVELGLPPIGEITNEDLFRQAQLMREEEFRAQEAAQARDQCITSYVGYGGAIGAVMFGIAGTLAGPEGTAAGIGVGLSAGAAMGAGLGTSLC